MAATMVLAAILIACSLSLPSSIAETSLHNSDSSRDATTGLAEVTSEEAGSLRQAVGGRRSLLVRHVLKQGRGGRHPPGKGKHPGKGGWKWPKAWSNGQGGPNTAASTTASTQGNAKATNGPDPNWDNTKWNCPGGQQPPSNFTQDLVNQIDFKGLSEKVGFQTYMPRIGWTCPTDGDFRPGGKQDLCVLSDHAQQNDNGLFRSDQKQAYGLFSSWIKCPSNANSSGLVTTFYTTSDFQVGNQDEIDYEFLNRYNSVLQINTWVDGKSVFFQNVFLGFDCAADWHQYGIFWTPQVLIFYVDWKAVAFYPNTNALDGKKFPSQQSWLVGSFWDGSNFNGNAEAWCGLRDPSTLNTVFRVQYSDLKVSRPIYNAMCPDAYLN